MRNTLAVWLIVSSLVPVWGQVCRRVQSGAPAPDVLPGVPLCGHAKAALAAALGPLGLAAPPLRDSASTLTDVLDYDLTLEVVPATRTLIGTNTMTVRSVADGLTAFRFDLHPVFAISEVSVNGAAAAYTRLDPRTLEVTLDRAYGAGEVFTVRVGYSGVPVSGGDWGSINFRTRAGAQEVWTLSQPWNSYTWWPCKDDNTDKATATLTFTVPQGLVVASNGLLQAVDVPAAGKVRYRWRTNYPTAPYLICFGATNYNRFQTSWNYGGGTLPLDFYIYPEQDSAGIRAALLRVRDMLSVFSTAYGLYPFLAEKYGIYQFGFGGGMEHQTMTGQGVLNVDWLSAHELAHQWFGDDVTCATWHDIWLHEGFATYSEALWAERLPGSAGLPALHQYMAQRRPSTVNGSVYVYDISSMANVFNYDLVYLKAAWVVHMLRYVLGDDVFFDALAAYRAAYSGSHVTTADFQAVCEAVSGRDLDFFFAPWVYGTGAPAYRYGWQAIAVDGRHYVELFLRQRQLPPMPEVFAMPVQIQLVGAGGGLRTVWNGAREQYYLLPVDGPEVTNLAVDPTPWILRTNLQLVQFAEGPPKLVSLAPAPGAAIPVVDRVTVGFHKDVNLPVGAVTLSGPDGLVPLSTSYDATRFVLTLGTDAGPLPPGEYTLTVADNVTGVLSGQALDGELGGAEPLPSGDGVAGGAAVATFFVPVWRGDLNCDGVVNFDDLDPFVTALGGPTAYAAAYPACEYARADLNNDGRVDFDDIDPLVDLLAGR